MTKNVLLIIMLLTMFCIEIDAQNSFKTQQLTYARVKTAYAEKEKVIQKLIANKGFAGTKWNVFLRIFKKEALVEVLISKKAKGPYQKVFEYPICASSGVLGPKRKEGDEQVPEGFYHINMFNPASNFYVSLGVSYPNASDKIFSDKKHPGGNIFIHGNCVTIGCIPISDNLIKELYVICVEARNNGQTEIPVHIFPFRMTDSLFEKEKSQYFAHKQLISFWENLREGYKAFEKNHELPSITVNSKGKYIFDTSK
ncbi:MAG: L,D-transpeptidase family protein [Bacteroidota bacterium]